MKQNPGSTIIENAKITIRGFQQIYDRLQQQVNLRGQSQSTHNNYIRKCPACKKEAMISIGIIPLMRSPCGMVLLTQKRVV